MRWTNDKPVVPGWYWYKDETFGPAPVEVDWTGFVDDAVTPGVRQLDIVWPEDYYDLPMYEDASGCWAGPIVPPAEKEVSADTVAQQAQ
jgi:hypothetical protein